MLLLDFALSLQLLPFEAIKDAEHLKKAFSKYYPFTVVRPNEMHIVIGQSPDAVNGATPAYLPRIFFPDI